MGSSAPPRYHEPVCLIAFATGVGENVIVLAANRDEYHARPTAPASAWSDAPLVFARARSRGRRDMARVSRTGRLAAVTNVRGPAPERRERSRGNLCRDFVTGSADAATYGRRVIAERDALRGLQPPGPRRSLAPVREPASWTRR